jgi:hypothetical protein
VYSQSSIRFSWHERELADSSLEKIKLAKREGERERERERERRRDKER